jgi:hypothetical protein
MTTTRRPEGSAATVVRVTPRSAPLTMTAAVDGTDAARASRAEHATRGSRLLRLAKLRLKPSRTPSGLEAGISASRRRVTENPPSRRSWLGRELASTAQMLANEAQLGIVGRLPDS